MPIKCECCGSDEWVEAWGRLMIAHDPGCKVNRIPNPVSTWRGWEQRKPVTTKESEPCRR